MMIEGWFTTFFDGSARSPSLPVEHVFYKSVASIDTVKCDRDIDIETLTLITSFLPV